MDDMNPVVPQADDQADMSVDAGADTAADAAAEDMPVEGGEAAQ